MKKESIANLKKGFYYILGKEMTLVFQGKQSVFRKFEYIIKYDLESGKMSCIRDYIYGRSIPADFSSSQLNEIQTYIKGLLDGRCEEWKTTA